MENHAQHSKRSSTLKRMRRRVELSRHDLAILSRVSQYRSLANQKRLELLRDASADAQQIGRAIVTGERLSHPELQVVVELFERWANAEAPPRSDKRSFGAPAIAALV